MTTISIRVEKNLKNRIADFAQSEKSSMNAFISSLLQQEIERREQEQIELEKFYSEADQIFEKMIRNQEWKELDEVFGI